MQTKWQKSLTEQYTHSHQRALIASGFFHRRAPTSPHAPTLPITSELPGDTYNTYQWVLLLLLFLNILLFLIYNYSLTTSDAHCVHSEKSFFGLTLWCVWTVTHLSPLQSESELSFITLIGNQPILSQRFFYFLTFWKSLKDVYVLQILFIYRFVSNLFF